LALGVLGLEKFDALNGIAAAKSQQRIATPFCPGLEAAKWLAAVEVSNVLPPPSPDRKYCG
jgi:hypothetical protein